LQNRQGRVRPAESYLSYFLTEELDRGNRQRLDGLAHDLTQISPDIICLQEVAAGCPWTACDDEIFHRQFAEDWFEANSALGGDHPDCPSVSAVIWADECGMVAESH
jgi:hypothetical protein